jgi:hypothetical protein
MKMSIRGGQSKIFSLRNFLPDDTVKEHGLYRIVLCFCVVVQVGSIRATVHDMYRVFSFFI